MSKGLAAVLALVALVGCSALPSSHAVAWGDCARTESLALLDQGMQPSWPQTPELPTGEPLEQIALGRYPPDAIHDAIMRTLYLAQGRNAFYVHQTGGISGLTFIYGPISLQDHCPAPASGAT